MLLQFNDWTHDEAANLTGQETRNYPHACLQLHTTRQRDLGFPRFCGQPI